MFKNVAPTDFSLAHNRDAFQIALDKLEDDLRGNKLESYPLVNGKKVRCNEKSWSVDPSAPSINLGEVGYADPNTAILAIKSLTEGQKGWTNTSAEERVRVIREVGKRMHEQKFSLAALIVREVGKPWDEADADVIEAIDFCNFYAQQMHKLADAQLTAEIMGEDNRYSYRPKGLTVVIAPWNFPLAIACGMTVAALVSGNATILKPAEQSSLIAYRFAELLLQSGVPKNAFAFLPGIGETIGRQLVEAPEVKVICFTGSKSVGLEIIKSAAQLQPGQKHIKKVIAELGGKNAVIVDEDADLDEAIKGILYSSFAYAGQKCSACSRVIVVGSNYETFLKRISEATRDLIIGPAQESATFIGPVIEKEAHDRLNEQIERASKDLMLAFKGEALQGGYFVPPTIFRDVPTDSWLWNTELFGPVIACHHVKNFRAAIDIANDCEYALTGGVFSRSPSNIEIARAEFEVGNLYINRSCTGAIVGRQPFGGYKLSGIGSKAGGKDYLLQFLDPCTVSENTMRCGFTPEFT